MQEYDLAFVKGDEAGMKRIAALGRGKPGEDLMSGHEAFALAYFGHLQQARTTSRRAVDLAQRASERERAGLFETGAALLEAFSANLSAATRDAGAALELSSGRDVEYGAAVALALSGNSSRAQTLANDLEK